MWSQSQHNLEEPKQTLQYFWKEKAGKHSFTWATWNAADGKILRGRETQRWEIKPHSPWQSTRKLRKLNWNCTTMAAAFLLPQTQALKACPEPMKQCAKTRGTRFSGPVAACFSQNLLGAVAHSQPSPLCTGKIPPKRRPAQAQTTHTGCQQIGRMILAQMTGCLQDKAVGLEGPVLSYSFWKA